jgi:TRAP-type mannitol/chloroaromatic compound transport system permease small subunit
MKCLIAGFVILISGILLSIELAQKKTNIKGVSKEVPNIQIYIYPYLIPLGLTVATAGIGEIIQKRGQKRSGKYTSMYYKKPNKAQISKR